MCDQVENEYTPGVPAWFNGAFAQIRQDLNAGLVANLEAINSNNQRKNFNIKAHANNGQIPLFSYRNTNQALGGPLPGRPQPAVLPTLPAIGATIPTPPFPRDMNDADSFTMDQIEALSMVLNNDFGIVAQDSLLQCRNKMKDYLFRTMN